METLKPKLKNIYDEYLNKLNVLNEDYKQYQNTDYYASSFIRNKEIEKDSNLSDLRESYIQKVREVTNSRLKEFEPNTSLINSLEYQTKLTNILNLLNMSKGNIEVSMLDFIVEARDKNTLDIIKNTYSDYEEAPKLFEYFSLNNLDEAIAGIKFVCDGLVDVIKFGEEHSYNTRVAVYNLNN